MPAISKSWKVSVLDSGSSLDKVRASEACKPFLVYLNNILDGLRLAFIMQAIRAILVRLHKTLVISLSNTPDSLKITPVNLWLGYVSYG